MPDKQAVNKCRHGIVMGEPWDGVSRIVACTCDADRPVQENEEPDASKGGN